MSVSIRDPIHGSVSLSPNELRIVDHPVFQRLRGIKQLGFTDQAFPGATHTRYAHSIGAMHVASRMFDAIFPKSKTPLTGETHERLRQTLRLGLLLHDLGHAPGSHASEFAMPMLSKLELPDGYSSAERRATHEDYTVKLLIHSPLTEVITNRFEHLAIDARDIAHLVTGAFPERSHRFVCDGVDYFPVLTQLVSGEMDADRMDYLQRDSFFTGVAYGKYDQTWLLENLSYHLDSDQAHLALDVRALFAFEDFLLSRYHMFVSVYLHYISVGIEHMLRRFYEEAPGEFIIPSDVDEYIQTDDVSLWSALRASENRWAQRIAQRQIFRRLIEFDSPDEASVEALKQALERENVEFFVSKSKTVLSKPMEKAVKHPIYVHERDFNRTSLIWDRAQIFKRYESPIELTRFYVDGADLTRSRKLIQPKH